MFGMVTNNRLSYQIKIDWKSYFREFSSIHGGEPVLYRQHEEIKRSGYLLFSDGWMYSATNPAGPEYPPPADKEQHLKLIRDYWTIRKVTFETEYRALRDTYIDLVRIQQGRSARLQVPEVVVVEDESGRSHRQKQAIPVDFMSMVEYLEDLLDRICECDKRLESIELPEVNFDAQFKPAGVMTILEEMESERGAKV